MTHGVRLSFYGVKEHLQYEVRILLGAQLLVKATENDGNLQNYFKDSVYVHTRALYQFFTSGMSGNDTCLEDIGQIKLQSPLYNKWREPLNRRVMHIMPTRLDRNNSQEPVSTDQLSDQTDNFCLDIEALWMQWMKKDSAHSKELTDIWNNAKKEASDDLGYFTAKWSKR